MDAQIPTADEVRTQLTGLSHGDVMALASSTGVPFTTLWKIRSGETQNPGLETVRRFWPELAANPRKKAEA